MPDRALRVLYIDDDPALVRLIERVLHRHGHTLVHAADAEIGLARLAEGGIDVVCLDHHLPVGTGLDVLTRLRDVPNAPPVVYVTGSSETSVAVSALKSGAFDYVAKSAGGDFPELLVSAVDQAAERARLLRARDRAEAELRRAKDHAELLLQEVNHRVANSLAMVSALVRLQANAVADPATREALIETHGRISAIAEVHKRLHTPDDARLVAINEYLASLIAELENSVVAGSDRIRVTTLLEPLRLPTDIATSIGMVAFELLTNAMKYAYPDGRSGEIRVTLRNLPEGGAELSVEDDGIGWAESSRPKGTGLGTRLIKAMAANLRSSVEYDDRPTGTRAVLRIPA